MGNPEKAAAVDDPVVQGFKLTLKLVFRRAESPCCRIYRPYSNLPYGEWRKRIFVEGPVWSGNGQCAESTLLATKHRAASSLWGY